MKKIPCATCQDMCGNAIGLYNSYHLVVESAPLKVTAMSLYCHKEKVTYELDPPYPIKEKKE